MYPLMLQITFVLGVILVLAALVAFFGGRGAPGGITIRLGEFVVNTPSASLALLFLGMLLIGVSINSFQEISLREEQAKSSAKLTAVVAKLPPTSLAQRTDATPPTPIERAQYKNL